MEYFGVFALVMLLCYASYPSITRKLERKMRKMQYSMQEKLEMSKIITELIGKSCKITKADGVQIAEDTIILDADMDWVKLEKTNKKGSKTIEIIRIDAIEAIDLVVV